MAFNLGNTSNNSGKLHISDFLSPEVQNTEKNIPVDLLIPWENQPFKMYSDYKLNELAESIKENGLLSRIIVCPSENGKYRIIAGHNRVEACKIAGMTEIPSIVKNVDENRAKLIMADTNLCQRTELLPSERAYAYKAQQEALIALGSPRATKEIAEKYGEDRRTIQRYISCSRLIPQLMDMWDNGRFTLPTACSLSGMRVSSQNAVVDYLTEDSSRSITPEQAKQLANRQIIFQNDIIEVIEQGTSLSAIKEKKDSSVIEDDNTEKAEKKNKSTARDYGKKITLRRKEITDIIGEELSNDEISEYFYFCLQRSDLFEEWHNLYTKSNVNANEEDELDEDPEI